MLEPQTQRHQTRSHAEPADGVDADLLPLVCGGILAFDEVVLAGREEERAVEFPHSPVEQLSLEVVGFADLEFSDGGSRMLAGDAAKNGGDWGLHSAAVSRVFSAWPLRAPRENEPSEVLSPGSMGCPSSTDVSTAAA